MIRIQGAERDVPRKERDARVAETLDRFKIVGKKDLYGRGVVVEPGPEVSLPMDADQVEQVLINLIKNAVEAAGEPGEVRVRWRCAEGDLVVLD